VSAYGGGLLPQHAEKLASSAISPEVASERGYLSADNKSQLERYGFGPSQRRPPALVIPLHGVTGDVVGHQLRPDDPRAVGGRVAKYETKTGQRSVLDVPCRVRLLLGDPAVPLVVTEGPLKADAAASVDLACVALLGVWSWRGRNDSDGLVVLPDWEYVAFNGRQVVIAFDSDVMLKSQVYGALRRLAALLEFRSAEVAYAYLPSGEHGEKVGLDDFFASGHSTKEFWSLVTAELRSPPSECSLGPAVPAREPAKPRALAEVEHVAARWLGDTDPVPLRAVLGTYAAHLLPGDPVWLLLVGGSGIGKTELLNSLTDCASVVTVSTITESGLLSATAAKERAPDASGGLLRLIGERGVLVIKDFTSLLSMNRDTRALVLAAFREIHDGQWSRHMGTDGGRSLIWKGKLGVIAGCTTAWDSAHAVTAQMGDRFVVCRLPEVSGDGIGARALAQVGREAEMRSEMREAVAGLFASELSAPHVLDDDAKRRLVTAASLVARARSPIERDYQGEVELVLDAEAPTRLVKQLERLNAGLGAIGLSSGASWQAVTRVALDSVPKLRRAVLDELERVGKQLTTSEMAVLVGHPTRTTRRALEDLTAHHVVERESGGDGKADLWSLSSWARAALSTIRTVPAMSGSLDNMHVVAPEDGVLNKSVNVLTDNSGKATDYRQDGPRRQVVDL
jgi:hypothetical protein